MLSIQADGDQVIHAFAMHIIDATNPTILLRASAPVSCPWKPRHRPTQAKCSATESRLTLGRALSELITNNTIPWVEMTLTPRLQELHRCRQ